MAEEPPDLEPLDPVVDSGHRSYMSAVEHKHLVTFQCRPPKEYLELDNLLSSFVFLETDAIVMPFYLLRGEKDFLLFVVLLRVVLSVGTVAVEAGDPHVPHAMWGDGIDTTGRLLFAWTSNCRHCVGPRVVPSSWKDDLEIRFAGVDRLDDLGALEPHPKARGPAKAWLLQFKATIRIPYGTMRAYAVNGGLPVVAQLRRQGTHTLCARDCRCTRGCCFPLELGFIQPAATYRGLCDARSKDESNARLKGCALLLRLWSYERLAVGRPIVDHRGYEARDYGQHDDDGPTMGTLWVCPRERTWANEQARRTYPSFVVALDRLVAEDVIWEPYSAAAVGSRAPYGLSSLCTSNETLWYTTASLVYDIYIEPHCPHRAMRQFGYAQQFGLSRLGQPCSGTWVTKVEPYVQAWDNAHRDVVHPVAPHTDWWYETFPTWYRPRTRCHVTYADTQPVPHESSSTDAYARHRDEALAGA
ncbi:hypothetical protein U9M48_043805 [Paspalum notatum var. saurae]|uniref:Aminotransferase-like plant mobile domain-containing protein n=1 Tax=Paspalum notatum var. saurae TaxID=547442 RepID=A0AAQ3UVM4_PASNO